MYRKDTASKSRWTSMKEMRKLGRKIRKSKKTKWSNCERLHDINASFETKGHMMAFTKTLNQMLKLLDHK